MQKAIFLDKDGTLIPDIPYNVDPDKITLQPDSAEGLKALHAKGYLLIIITNQAGLAYSYFTDKQFKDLMAALLQLLSAKGISISDYYYCPHHPEFKCSCRKPSPGLILQAAKAYDIDLAASWMIGDILNDVEAGNRAGCHSILIDNGNETEWKSGAYRVPAASFSNINDAAKFILKTL